MTRLTKKLRSCWNRFEGYNVTYPIAFFWEYDTTSDGSVDQSSRTVQCNGDQVTGFIDTFCNKVEMAGFTACYYATKTMAYDKLDLSRLTNYDLWYAEYASKPSFYYDFGMWQYTDEGNRSRHFHKCAHYAGVKVLQKIT